MCIFKTLWEKQSFIFCETNHDSFWCSSFLPGIRNSNYQSARRTLFEISYTLSLLRHTSTIFLYLKNSLFAFTFDRFMAWIKNSWSVVVTSPSPPPAAAPTLLSYCPASCSFLQKLNIDSYFLLCNVSFVSLLWNFSLYICLSAGWLCVPGSRCLCPYPVWSFLSFFNLHIYIFDPNLEIFSFIFLHYSFFSSSKALII